MLTHTMECRKPEGDLFSVVISGDICPREENTADAAARAEEITGNVKPFFESADFRILQWECAVTCQDTPIPKTGPNLRCGPEALRLTTALNTDAVLLANNHTGDYGTFGIADTLSAFRALNIRTAGIGMTPEEAEKPLIFGGKDVRIALVNAAEHEFGFAYGDRAGSNGLDPMRLAGQIRELKQEGFLAVIALHGGIEHYGFPAPREQKLCRFLADCGAAAVFCCHSHCPQGIEFCKGVPIVYSPGNFYFPGRPTSPSCWYHGYLPKFYFDCKGACKVEILPFFNRKQAVELLSEEEMRLFEAEFEELNAPLHDAARSAELYRAWCLHKGIPILCNMPQRSTPENWLDPATVRSWLGFRNQLVNESHCDLARTSLLMIERGEVCCSDAAWDKIVRLQNPVWVKKDA